MNKYIKIEKIYKKDNKIEILFSTSKNMSIFFTDNNFWLEYNFNIEKIPDSVVVIPFLSNILPIAWLNNSEIILDEIDKDFFESINNFKQGYITMYPMLEFFDIKISYKKLIKNQKNKTRNTRIGAFFSGGVDAYATLFSHIDEKPTLITVWGADISTSNQDGWNKMKTNVSNAANQYNLDIEFIKSNFKEFLNSPELNKIVNQSGDKWWHGFQHGIGLISLAAPISIKRELSLIYIAASYTKHDKVTCASHPNIDEHIRFCATKIHHDQYELNREMKINKIISVANKLNTYPNIHVCWENTSGENCCKCEKCCRTIIEIMLANNHPQKYGFQKCDGKHLKKRMTLYNDIDKILYPIWQNIINIYKETKDSNQFKQEINWIEKFNYKKQKTFIKKIFRKVEKIIEKKK